MSHNDVFADDNNNYADECHDDDHVDKQNCKLFGVLKINKQKIVATVIYCTHLCKNGASF